MKILLAWQEVEQQAVWMEEQLKVPTVQDWQEGPWKEQECQQLRNLCFSDESEEELELLGLPLEEVPQMARL